MTLQNRVDPWGHLVRMPSRSATRMGNRGILHNEYREIVRQSKSMAWLCCSMKLGDIHRTVFQVAPKFSYSELFFLDEATALAAGHRPCRDCQPFRFAEFKRAWCKAHCPDRGPSQLLISEVDETLQVERIQSDGTRPTYRANLIELPVGTLFTDGTKAFLFTSGGIYEWSFDGYIAIDKLFRGTVEVLTPPSIVSVLRAGYVPVIHGSAAH